MLAIAALAGVAGPAPALAGTGSTGALTTEMEHRDSAADNPEEARRTAARAAFLRAEIEAAKGRSLYLVLDPQRHRLEVRAEGVTLQELELAEATLLHAPGAPAAWPAVAFRLAGPPPEVVRPVLTPPGTEPPAGALPGAAPVAPPPSTSLDFRARQRRELLDRAPARYLLRFEPSLEMAVESDGRPAPGTGDWRERLTWLGTRLGTPFGATAPPPRLRLVLSPDDAQRLALSLHPQVPLLIVPP